MCADAALDDILRTRMLEWETLGQMPVINTGIYTFSLYRRWNTICLNYKYCPVNDV